jgi:hypothetical protein
MVSANDPVESFFNSIQVMKESLSPLELGFRKAAKDFEHCFSGVKNNRIHGVCLIAQVKDGGQFQICDVKKKKGLSMKVPLKSFLGMFSQNSGNGNKNQLVKENESSCTNCLKFSVTWSLLVSGFFQSLPIPFKSGKKRFQKVCDEDNNKDKCSCMKQTFSSCEVKHNESKGQFVRTIKEKVVKRKDGKQHVSLECLIGFIFDQLSHTLQNIDHGINGMKGNNNNNDIECEKISLHSAPFGHVNAFTSFLEGHKVDVNGFLGNLNFAKVGGVPSSAAGEEIASQKEMGDSGSEEIKEESVGISAQKVASNIFSIPLTNVERLKTTLSTVSLTELIELLPQLGKTSKDHPDKKKLFSVQDFFRYTESEGETSYI